MKNLSILIIIFPIILIGCRIGQYHETRPHTEKIELQSISDSSIVFENEVTVMRFSKIDLNEILEKTKNLNTCDSIRLNRLKNDLKTNWDSTQIHLFHTLEKSKKFGIDIDTAKLEMRIIHNLLQTKRAIILNKNSMKKERLIYYVIENSGYCCCRRFYRFVNEEEFFVSNICIDVVIMKEGCN